MAGSLILLFKEVVESQVNVGVSNGAVVDVSQIMILGTPQISLLSLHWQVPEHIFDPLGSDRRRLGCHPIKVEMGALAMAPDEMASLRAPSHCGGSSA